MPEDSRKLVERATHPEHPRDVAQRLGENWEALWLALYGQQLRQWQRGEAGLIDFSRPYTDALIDQRIPTRLGEGRLTVRVEGEMRSLFNSEPIDALPIPGRWLLGVEPETPAKVQRIDGKTVRVSVRGVSLCYSELGLQQDG